MAAPLILISNQRLKPGSLDQYKANYARAVERFQAHWPGTLSHSAYLSQDASEVSVVMVFRDAGAMELHMQGLGDAPKRAQESMDFVSLQVFGSPTEATIEILHRIVGPDIPVTITPQAVDGYFRSGQD